MNQTKESVSCIRIRSTLPAGMGIPGFLFAVIYIKGEQRDPGLQIKYNLSMVLQNLKLHYILILKNRYMILYFLSHVGIPRDVFIQNMRNLRAAGPSWNGCSIAVCGKAGGWSERTVTLLYILIKFYGKFICPFFFFMIFWKQQITASCSIHIYLFRPFGQKISSGSKVNKEEKWE